ncbi:MAG: division/cell wall cluster transcriptional repressor MraZ [Bacteroidetes bacterium]|nr:division/cell wall cluster transcriptional repressor MraZ [Bacteroidota bacterium]
MIHLIGEYEVKVDDKGRIMVPAQLRKQLPADMQDRFVLNRGLENCVTMWPYPLFLRESARINRMNRAKKVIREYQRFFANGASDLVLDNSGRLLLPKHLMDWASIGREIVISSFGKTIEIWAKDKFKTPAADESEKYADISEQIFDDEDLDLSEE